MEFDYREYYYLSQCYENEVDDVILIENIILKYSLDKKFKSKEISIIHKEIKEEYKLFIPTSILEISILKLIKRFPGAFEYKTPVLSMRELPATLIEEFNKLQNEFETNIREIRNAFNEKIDNSHFKITQTEIILLLDKIKEYIIKDKKINDFKNQKELLFFDWVYLVYSENKDQTLIKILNKTIYPLIIYYYFIDYEKPSHKLSEFKIILDTNIVIHLIGINGKTRKDIAIEFLNLIGENGASIIISIETLNEIRDLLKGNPNYDVTFFKRENQALTTQLIENSKSAVESILKSVNVKYSFDNRSKHLNKSKFLEWDSLYSSLMNFKNKIKYKPLTENSIDHDVNLIYISECFKPINNFYDHRSPIASADNKLVQWFSEEMEKRFQMKSKSLIPLYKLSLIFWRDGNKNHENEFVSNTWSFICESIPYF
ncbi:hypothetical protein [Leptospira alexanderi]|nr:hypothetical protein [Leptospira alexanderi]